MEFLNIINNFGWFGFLIIVVFIPFYRVWLKKYERNEIKALTSVIQSIEQTVLTVSESITFITLQYSENITFEQCCEVYKLFFYRSKIQIYYELMKIIEPGIRGREDVILGHIDSYITEKERDDRNALDVFKFKNFGLSSFLENHYKEILETGKNIVHNNMQPEDARNQIFGIFSKIQNDCIAKVKEKNDA